MQTTWFSRFPVPVVSTDRMSRNLVSRLRTLLIKTGFPRTMPVFRLRVIRFVLRVAAHIFRIILRVFGVIVAPIGANKPVSNIIRHGLGYEARRRRLYSSADTRFVMDWGKIFELM